MDNFNDYRDLTDEQAKDILNEFIHTDFFDRRNDDIGKAIVRAIVMFEGRIEADKHCKGAAETIKDMYDNAVRKERTQQRQIIIHSFGKPCVKPTVAYFYKDVSES